MKKQYSILFLVFGLKCLAQTPLTFTISNGTGSNSITCLTPSITMIATSNYTTSAVIYTWAGPSFLFVGDTVDINSPGSYTVIASSNTLTSFHTFTLGIDTIRPITSIGSTIAVLYYPATLTVTVISPSTNFVNHLYLPVGGDIVGNSVKQIYNGLSQGTYTHCTQNLVNGCWSCFNFFVSYNTAVNQANTHTIDVTLYPNPANDILKITIQNPPENEMIQARIINNLSEIVWEKEFPRNEHLADIDTSTLLPGVYSLQIINCANETIIKRFIISK